MADKIQKTKTTSTPRKTATKKEKVAVAANVTKQPSVQVEPLANEIIGKPKTDSKSRKTITSIDKVADAPKARQLSRQEVEQVAYRFWAERGYQHGYALQDWLRAEQELLKMAS